MSSQPEIEQSMAAWREDEEKAFGGQCLSAETRAGQHAGHARVDKHRLQRLAEDHPELFMGLVELVSPLSQDVLIQHYMLRRTQEQIGLLVGVKQPGLHYTLARAIEELKGKRKASKADFRHGRVEVRRGRWVGASEVPIEESVLAMCFQPTNGNV